MAPPDNDKPIATIPRAPLVAGGAIRAIVPTDFESCYRLAQVVHAAKMAPASLDSIEKITICIMHGLEVGLTPMASLQSIAVIGNMPVIWGDGMLALVRASGLLEEIIEDVEVDDKNEPTLATCRVKRRGEAQWKISSFTRVEAQRAGLWNKRGPWEGYKARMLKMRARAWALRDGFADVLRGLHMAEEALDMGSVSIAPPPREPRRSDVDNDTVEMDPAEFPDRLAAGTGPAAAKEGQPASPPVSPSPQTSAEAESEPARGGPAVGHSTATTPPAGQPPDLSMPIEHWTIDGDVVGQEAVIKRLEKLLDLAETLADVDAIETQNAARIAKITGVRRSALNDRFRSRRIELAP